MREQSKNQVIDRNMTSEAVTEVGGYQDAPAETFPFEAVLGSISEGPVGQAAN